MGIKQENYFWLNNGSQIRNLYELSKALENMPEELFNHHVTGEKNDFAVWIDSVVGDKELANRVLAAKTSRVMSIHINRRITHGKPRKKMTTEESKKTDNIMASIIAKKQEEKENNKIKGIISRRKTAKKIRINIPKIVIKKPSKTDIPMKSDSSPKPSAKEEKKHIKLSNLFAKKPEIDTKIKCGMKCPYRNFQGFLLDILVGIMLGLTIAIVLSALL